MTFRGMLDRKVTLRTMVVTGKDARNDDVVEPGPILEDVPAARELEEATEQTDDRDAQERRFVYLFPARHLGAPVVVDGYAELVDGDEVFTMAGDPELVVRRRGGRPHHWEATVERRS